jgi:hypothetical protein
MATMTPDSVESVVEGLAAKPSGYPFGASYIAQLAGVDVRDAYAELERLAARKDLERHFELISPSTGKALAEFRLGDKVPVGDTREPVGDDEAPFVISDDDIWISFSPTAKLRARVAATHKKKRPTPSLVSSLQQVRRILWSIGVKTRSEAQRRSMSSTTGH